MILWNFIYDGIEHNLETTKDKAEEYAHEWWDDNGDGSDTGHLICRDYNNDATELIRVVIELERDCSRSDFDEHNVYWNLV